MTNIGEVVAADRNLATIAEGMKAAGLEEVLSFIQIKPSEFLLEATV